MVKREGNLQVYNPIYAEVFNESWIDGELAKLRPYAESFRAWVISGKIDKSRLLRGDALKEAEQWAKEKNPSAEDQDFLSESRIQEREEEIAVKEKEAELGREKEAREAAEQAEQIQLEANQQAQRKIRRGGLILGVALVMAGLLGVFAIFSGNKIRIAEQEVQNVQALAGKSRQELDNTNAQKKQVEQELIKSRQDTEKKRIELVSATQNLGKLQNSLKSVTANRKDAEIRLRQAKELVIHARKNLANAEKRESQMQQSLVQLEQNVSLANQKKFEAERLAMQAQTTKVIAESALAKAEIDRKKSANELLKAQTALNKVQKEQQVIAENNKNVDELSKLIDDLYGNDKPEDERQPEAAKDAIEQIGLSFTDFTDNKPELKKALLKSSIALAYLRLDPLDKNKKAKTAIDESIDVIEKNPNLFKSTKGKPIAFFSYAIRGNLLEEQNPKAIPAEYEIAFRYAETPYRRDGLNFKPIQDAVVESYELFTLNRDDFKALALFTLNRDDFKALATASLKKHYDFIERQLLQDLNSLLARKAWKEANLTTVKVLFASIFSKELDWYFIRESYLSCSTLKKIDTLWSKHSGGRFGFKAQKELWEETGKNSDGKDDKGTVAKFYNRIGWTEGKPVDFTFIDYDALFETNNLNKAPKGNLPTLDRAILEMIKPIFQEKIRKLTANGMSFEMMVTVIKMESLFKPTVDSPPLEMIKAISQGKMKELAQEEVSIETLRELDSIRFSYENFLSISNLNLREALTMKRISRCENL